jgi:3-oxoacyl-[acyl-carrier protein] reductase
MDLNLKGKTALVTGSSQGIGKACVIALAKEGCNIILCSRSIEKLYRTAMEIVGMKLGGIVCCETVDATNREDIKRFMGTVGKLDILVNNVGGGTEKPLKLWGLTEEQWIDMYKLNTLSMVWFTEFAVPLLERSSQPRIINIGTKASHEPGWNNPHYGAAKAALDYLNKRIANELAPKGICVNIIGPHALICDTWERDVLDRAQTLGISFEEARAIVTKEVVGKIPMGRQGTIEDAANLVVFLASAQANFITGSYIPVDGGTTKSVV